MGQERTRIGVLGAGGRMGAAIIAALAEEPRAALVGGVEQPGHPACGRPIGDGLIVCANATPVAVKADVLIDFTQPAALAEHLRAAVAGKAAILVGTTGLDAQHHRAIDAAARDVAVLQTANTSLGITILAALVRRAAQALGPDWDIEILEMHHRQKRDAPSGTALLLGDAAASGRGGTLERLRLPPAETRGDARPEGGIGFASLRGGSVAGTHEVILAGPGERLVLRHVAETRGVFARGAIAAALWLAGRPAGRYRMEDLFGEPGRAQPRRQDGDSVR
jgi:4-hydroxy-tetrahydrodipicolinate reductase